MEIIEFNWKNYAHMLEGYVILVLILIILDIDFSWTWRVVITMIMILIWDNGSQINALKLLNVPMLVSEQNPTSLGKTIPEFDISGAKGPFAKTQFSMCTPEVSTCICYSI